MDFLGSHMLSMRRTKPIYSILSNHVILNSLDFFCLEKQVRDRMIPRNLAPAMIQHSELFCEPFEGDQTSYLYELTLKYADSEKNWPSSLMSLTEDACTRLGVLFSKDIIPVTPICRVCENHCGHHMTFTHEGTNERIKARLVSRTRLHISKNDIQLLKGFNQILHEWRSYGFAKVKNTAKKKEQYGTTRRSYLFVPLKREEALASTHHLSIDWGLVTQVLEDARLPIDSVPQKCISNLMCKHRGRDRYILRSPRKYRDSPLVSALSPIDLNADTKIRLKLEGQVTFQDYFKKKHNLEIRDVSTPFFQGHHVRNKLAPFNPFFPCGNDENDSTDSTQHIVHLVPEFLEALPMPLDFLFTVSFLPTILNELELQIVAAMHASSLLYVSPTNLDDPLDNFDNYSTCPSSLLIEACSLYPSKLYERLEFLGDSQLNFFIMMQVFEVNTLLQWDYETMEEIAARAKSNRQLAYSGNTRNFDSMIYTRRIQWLSSYQQSGPKVSTKQVCIPPSIMCDVVEASMAIAWLYGKPPDRFACIEKFLCLLDIPLPFHKDGMQSKPINIGPAVSKTDLTTRLNILSSLKDLAIPHEEWKRLLQLCEDPYVKTDNLLGILIENTNCKGAVIRTRSESEFLKPIFLVSFFDDPLDNTDSDSLIKIAKFRENLAQVGTNTLQSILSTLLFNLYPEATPNDLHMLRATVIDDTVLAYVMLKSDLSKFLFDRDKDLSLDAFWLEAKVATSIGEASWTKHKGWCIQNGMQEFQSRVQKAKSILSSLKHHDFSKARPRFCGVGGGRLMNHKRQLPSGQADNLAFSFKAFLGSMQLVCGYSETENIISIIFLELLLLRPDEVRQIYYHSSNLVQSYSVKV